MRKIKILEGILKEIFIQKIEVLLIPLYAHFLVAHCGKRCLMGSIILKLWNKCLQEHEKGINDYTRSRVRLGVLWLGLWGMS